MEKEEEEKGEGSIGRRTRGKATRRGSSETAWIRAEDGKGCEKEGKTFRHPSDGEWRDNTVSSRRGKLPVNNPYEGAGVGVWNGGTKGTEREGLVAQARLSRFRRMKGAGWNIPLWSDVIATSCLKILPSPLSFSLFLLLSLLLSCPNSLSLPVFPLSPLSSPAIDVSLSFLPPPSSRFYFLFYTHTHKCVCILRVIL